MARFARGDLTAFRNDPFEQTMAFDLDLTDVPLSFAVRLTAGAGGAPILLLTNGSGLSLLEVIDNGDGSFTSIVQLLKSKADWQAAIAAFVPVEPRVPVKLAWDLQWTPTAALVGADYAIEATIAIGTLTILESCNG